MDEYPIIGYSTAFVALIFIGVVGVIFSILAVTFLILTARKRRNQKGTTAPTKKEIFFFFCAFLGVVSIFGSTFGIFGTYGIRPIEHAKIYTIKGELTNPVVIETAERPYIVVEVSTLDVPVTLRNPRTVHYIDKGEITLNCRNVMLPRARDDVRCAIAE